jgi:hypothetical protein
MGLSTPARGGSGDWIASDVGESLTPPVVALSAFNFLFRYLVRTALDEHLLSILRLLEVVASGLEEVIVYEYISQAFESCWSCSNSFKMRSLAQPSSKPLTTTSTSLSGAIPPVAGGLLSRFVGKGYPSLIAATAALTF